jgi:F-type H+-transporting ATPase subunit b
VNAREQKISESLELAVKTQAEMKALKAENDQILKEARAERDNILKEAKDAANHMIEDAKTKSKVEAQKIVEAARLSINSEKAAAIAEIKTHVATLAVEIAEKVVRGELASDEKQKALAEKLAGDIQMN